MAKSKLMGSLTVNQALLLKRLFDLNNKSPSKYFKPKDLGSFKGNATIVNLRRFIDKKWVEFSAEQKAYKITPDGISEYLFIQEMAASVEEHEVFGSGSNLGLLKAKKIFLKKS